MKSFTDLAQHLKGQGPRSADRVSPPENNPTSPRDLSPAVSRGLASMAAQFSLDEPVIRRGVVELVHKGGSAFAVLGSGDTVFVTRSIARRLGLSEGDVLEMTIVGNYKDSVTENVPYRALFAVRSTAPLHREEAVVSPVQSEMELTAPEPEPAPRLPGLKPGSFPDQIGPEMLAMMKPEFLYRARDFAHLVPENHSKKLTNVLEALLAIGRVQRISLHSSPDRKAGRLYWCLASQGPRILEGVLANGGGEGGEDESLRVL